MKSQTWIAGTAINDLDGIYSFTSGVIEKGDFDDIQAFVMLLAPGPRKDIDAINKYAAEYKHCSDYLVSGYNDSSRSQAFEKAGSEPKITVFVSDWRVVILIVWLILISSVGPGLHVWGKRKKFPMDIHGEEEIGRRWFLRCTEEIPLANTRRIARKEEFLGVVQNEWFKWFAQSNETSLNVQVGETEDGIVVWPNALCVYRELGKRFKDVC